MRRNAARRLAALGHAALDVVPLDVVGVVGLDVSRQTVERALDRLLGGAVHHARLHLVSKPSLYLPTLPITHVLRRIIRRPANECDLAPRALAAIKLVLDVEDSIAPANALLALAVLALCAQQLLAEGVEVGFLGCLLDHDFFPVVADLVDDPFDVLAELELVEGADALGRDGDTGWVLVEGRGWREGAGG